MATVSLRNVYKTYPGAASGGEIVAVKDFNLEVADREFVVFVGPSGCGKSTTLRMIAGLEEISRGDVHIGERRVNDVPPMHRDVAMVFQNYALYPHMSVYENLAFGLKLRKVPKPEIRKRVVEAAEILGIGDCLDRKPKALSGGQRQRVALGRAIVRQPKVFLFDEPLSNLDARMRVQTRAEITKLHRRLQATMIYVTHDQVEAMTMGDRIVVMDGGVAQQIDAPLRVYHEPANLFVAGFLGTPPMNVVRGTLRGGGGKLVFEEHGGGPLKFVLPGSPVRETFVGKGVIVGIRPEDLRPVSPGETVSGAAFPTVVDLVEPMGGETNVYVQTGQHTMICRVQGSATPPAPGMRAKFAFDTAKAHLFDPETSARIV